MSTPIGADKLACWTLCETVVDPADNGIRTVVDTGGGLMRLRLLRPITPGAVTTISYNGNGSTCEFISHPGNVNADGVTNIDDLVLLIDTLNGPLPTPLNPYKFAINHTGGLTPLDLTEWVNLIGGSGNFAPGWNGTSRPTPDGCPPQ